MALYTVKKVVEPDKRGVERERFQLYDGDQYVTGIDIPKVVTHDWCRTMAKLVRANLLNRHGDPEPEFGALPEDQAAITFAGMLNYA